MESIKYYKIIFVILIINYIKLNYFSKNISTLFDGLSLKKEMNLAETDEQEKALEQKEMEQKEKRKEEEKQSKTEKQIEMFKKNLREVLRK
jgi:hypothetical protein